jgi:hypothetical protein
MSMIVPTLRKANVIGLSWDFGGFYLYFATIFNVCKQFQSCKFRFETSGCYSFILKRNF